MRRRERGEEGRAGHERWLVSYADFITLLFAFFTSMYAISSVNEAKYRSLSTALSTAFRAGPAARTAPGSIPPLVEGNTGPGPVSRRFNEAFSPRYRGISEAVRSLPGGLGVHLVTTGRHLIVRLPSGTFFGAGSARLTADARAALKRIAHVLAAETEEIRIEGHTDNVPIHNRKFRSNWELSGARALRVLEFLATEGGLDGRRLVAVAYGQYRPIATNATPGGRRKNRRVDIVVPR